MNTKLSHGTELREKILDGVNTLADYVATTLGPKGQNVLIQKKDKTPFITKDGVTVAQSVSFADPHVNAAANIVKQVSAMTNAEAGDGTTTSTILARSIFRIANKHVVDGSSPIDIKRGLDKCCEEACGLIKEFSKPITSEEEIKHVATISANNDAPLGDLVATAVSRVGKYGSVSVENARSHDTTLELVEGFKFSSGYAARAFVTDERTGVCKYENPMFLITDHRIEQVADILPALEIAARESRPFVIVAEEIEGQALAALIMNAIRGTMKVAAVKAPSYGEDRRAILGDLALATGAKFHEQSLGHKLSDVSLSDFGQSRSIEVSKGQTIVVDGLGSAESIENRIEKIQNQIDETDDLHVAQRMQDRITRLSSGVAIIKVGANSEVEMVEKRHRIEDALEAVNSAQQEGVVQGGGMTLLRVSKALTADFGDNKEQEISLAILKEALCSPFVTMCVNAGYDPATLLGQTDNFSDSEGFNFLTGKVENLYNSGVIDPAKVTRCALKNAISVAGTLLLTNHSIVEA